MIKKNILVLVMLYLKALGRLIRNIFCLALTFLFIMSCLILPLTYGGTLSCKVTTSGVIKGARKHIVAYVPRIPDEFAEFVASHFDIMVTNFYLRVEKIKAKNPNVIILGYRNVMAMHPHYEDWEEVNSHEDWFLHDVNGNRLVNKKYGWYAMDVGSPGWREHYAKLVKAKLDANPAFDGLFADDVWEWNKYKNSDFTVDPTLIPSEIQQRWHNDMIGMLQYIKQVIGNKLLIINTDDLSGDYLKYADGMMFENFGHGSWETLDQFTINTIPQINALLKLSGTGKYVIVQSMALLPAVITPEDLNKAHKVFLYCFCSYLLGLNGSLTTFGFTNIHRTDAQIKGYYEEMDFDIGFPLGSYYIRDNLYIRNFSRATVLVNFSNETRTTIINAKNYTLSPYSGIIVPSH